jgi:hypothetical protein
MLASGMGARATRVSQGLRRSRKYSANTVKKTVLALYMRAGPSSMRTAFRSLVMPGHDVAGAIALIEARSPAFPVAEKVVAQVELDLPRDADENPALGVEKDAFDHGAMATRRPAKRRIARRGRPGAFCSLSTAQPRTLGNWTAAALVAMQESVPHRYPQR